MRLKPAAPRSRVKHFTTEPLRCHSDFMFCYKVIRDLKSMDHLCINPILWNTIIIINSHSCTKILTKIHPNYRWISGKTDMEFQFSSWNWQGDGILAKIQVGLPRDSMWIFRIPAGNFQAHGISFSGFFHLECFKIVFKIHLETLKDKEF